MPLARTAAAILALTGLFWITALYVADSGPTVTRKAPPPFASGGRHRAAPDAG